VDQRDSYLRALQEVTRYVHHLGDESVQEFTPWTGHAISMFSHARELLVASTVLLERNMVGPAFVLQRPLFEDSLRLAEYAAASDVAKVGLIAAWLRAGLKKALGLAQKAARDGGEVEAGVIRTNVADQRNKIDRALKRHGAVATPFMNVETAAKAFGREDDLPGYEMSHHAVHSDDLVHSMSREMGNEGVMAVGKSRRVYLDAVAELAARSGLHLARSFHAITGTAVDEDSLAGLAARLVALNESDDGEAS